MKLGKNRQTLAIIIIFVVIVGGISGYILNTEENAEEDRHEKSSYVEDHFELEMESENRTMVLWPIPYDAKDEWDEHYGNLSDLVYDLKITEGNGVVEVNKTEHGRALKVAFKGKIKIVRNKKIYRDERNYENKSERYYFDDLTMRNETKMQEDHYFVYSSSDNVEIINFDCYDQFVGELDSQRMVDRYVSGLILEKGWQSVEL